MMIFICLVGVAIGITFLTLHILIPPEKIEVPSIAGKSLEKGVLLLSERDLSLKVVGKEYSSQIPQGIIVSQVPSPGVRVSKNRRIEVVISEGTKVADIPFLVGKRLAEAKIYLSQQGLKVGSISYVYSFLPQGKTISQDPPAGIEMDREEGVNLLVSLGVREPQFYMPDLIGEKVERVKERFEKLSLKIGEVKEFPSSGKEGIILSQFPSPGSLVTQKTLIKLGISTSYIKRKSPSSEVKWILSSVEIPPGFGKKKLKVVIADVDGERTIDYGEKAPGERVWITSRVRGKGEIRIYVGDRLVNLEKVE
ncbi:MAG: PASTA domain-containing protein [Candidatus Aerophobetes bacterium]|nr:PASTA domain-containing protein [Candidatus Aerophobetes bacterium]